MKDEKDVKDFCEEGLRLLNLMRECRKIIFAYGNDADKNSVKNGFSEGLQRTLCIDGYEIQLPYINTDRNVVSKGVAASAEFMDKLKRCVTAQTKLDLAELEKEYNELKDKIKL